LAWCKYRDVYQEEGATKKTRGITTNACSLDRRIAALWAARERAQAMRFEPLTRHQMIDELVQLRKTLSPVVDESVVSDLAIACRINHGRNTNHGDTRIQRPLDAHTQAQ
jgi:hypothetical protein